MRTLARFFLVAASGAGFLGFGCYTTSTTVVSDDAGPGATSSGGSSSGRSSKSGGSSSSSGGSSTSSSGGSSTSSSGGTSTSSSGGTSTSSSGGTTKDASVDRNDPSSCPANVPLTAADLDAEIGFKAPAASKGACTANDLTQLESNFKNPNLKTYLDLGTGLSTTCKACVITYDTSSSWGPIVATQADGGQTGFINFGACFAYKESTACGKALQYEQFCYNIACNECATTATERQRCIGAAGNTGGMCEDFGDTTATSCPNIATTQSSCGSVLDAAKTLCGS